MIPEYDPEAYLRFRAQWVKYFDDNQVVVERFPPWRIKPTYQVQWDISSNDQTFENEVRIR